MKLLLAGAWLYPECQEVCAEAFQSLGVDVIPFRWHHYFQGRTGKIQDAIPFPGPAMLKLNHDFKNAIVDNRPDITFIWRGTHIFPSTLRAIKRKHEHILVSYNNDDPFGPSVHGFAPWHHHYLWKWYIKCLKEYDMNLVFRSININEAKMVGADNVHVLKPYYIPKIHRPVKLSEAEYNKYSSDAVFIGHYEPDGREEYIKALVKNGFHVLLFGGDYWAKEVLGEYVDYFGEIKPVLGDEYAKALCGAKICLCFLSKLNRDSYTTRCFEIPACGGLLLSERTEELQRMFIENKEAVFFSDIQELVEKVSWLISNPEICRRIAEAGRRRVQLDGHDVVSRMQEFLNLINAMPSK